MGKESGRIGLGRFSQVGSRGNGLGQEMVRYVCGLVKLNLGQV